MIIVTFLGNPGKKYRNNRHNIGFIIGDFFLRELGITANQNRFNSTMTKTSIQGTDTLMLFPGTYMNESGKAVREALKFYSQETSSLIVVHDDIELPFAEFRKKEGGGHKGQNGIRSIMQETGNGDFLRLRFGVGRPPDPRIPVADYVLSDFFKEEQEKIKEIMPQVLALLSSMISSIDSHD